MCMARGVAMTTAPVRTAMRVMTMTGMITVVTVMTTTITQVMIVIKQAKTIAPLPRLSRRRRYDSGSGHGLRVLRNKDRHGRQADARCRGCLGFGHSRYDDGEATMGQAISTRSARRSQGWAIRSCRWLPMKTNRKPRPWMRATIVIIPAMLMARPAANRKACTGTTMDR